MSWIQDEDEFGLLPSFKLLPSWFACPVNGKKTELPLNFLDKTHWQLCLHIWSSHSTLKLQMCPDLSRPHADRSVIVLPCVRDSIQWLGSLISLPFCRQQHTVQMLIDTKKQTFAPFFPLNVKPSENLFPGLREPALHFYSWQKILVPNFLLATMCDWEEPRPFLLDELHQASSFLRGWDHPHVYHKYLAARNPVFHRCVIVGVWHVFFV